MHECLCDSSVCNLANRLSLVEISMAWCCFLFRQSELLNRDQTEEWRGWMQLVILAYHYTGASQHLAIYVWIRVLVAAYIFMSAYGHFSYFWHKGEYGLQRVCQVCMFICHSFGG